MAEAQSVHARRWLLLMRGKIGSIVENLRLTFVEKLQARVAEYERLAAESVQTGEKSLAMALGQAGRWSAATPSSMPRPGAWAYAVCQVCGYVAAEGPPARCPVCLAVPEKFKRVE
jgi:rubrerythrin